MIDRDNEGVREWTTLGTNSSPSTMSQRRRSSAAHTRPAAPPPNLPIPSIPAPPLIQEERRGEEYNSSFADDLSDPPPQSILPPSSSRMYNPATNLLTVPDSDPNTMLPSVSRPPSSRRALTRALELAREAVQLDSTNDNPELAVRAYGKSVALLSEVMERVRRGEDSTESSSRRRNGRRRSVFAQEEEVRRLQNIHDTYADRMNILSIIYSIPPEPYSSHSAVYSSASLSLSTDSAPSTSPTSSASPSSDDISGSIPSNFSYTTNHTQEDILNFNDVHYGHDRIDDGIAAIGAAMFTRDSPSPSGPTISGLPPSSTHPYAIAPAPLQSVPPSIPAPTAVTPLANRVSSLGPRRPRASSALPPALPPPAKSPPPAPAPVVVEPVSDTRELAIVRQRGDSVAAGHKRTGSGSKLASLEEETDRYEVNGQLSDPRISKFSKPTFDSTRAQPYESPPLPPIPLSSPPTSTPTPMETPGTPRTSGAHSKLPPSPRLSNTSVPRPRGSSQISMRSDGSSQIINPIPNHGTIYQRRTKTSGPPTPRSSSPADSTASAGSVPVPRAVASSLPGNSSTSVVNTRSRSSSQPDRRPSVGNGRTSPTPEQRPPLPSTANGALPMPAPQRKSSFPTKIPPNAQQLTVQTDLPTATGLGPMPLVTPGLPLTPTSPLPPSAPSDPSRKPYHLMNLLRTTMVSPTGGYITRRLHVPQEVWSQGGAKLGNVIEKVRVVSILCTALEDLQGFSSECFGAGNVSSGMALGIGSIGRKEGEAWIAKLEDFSMICDGVVADFGKKLGVGEGFVLKKTTWGDKLGRRFDKFTNGKNLDSPAAYVQGLRKLFLHAQLLDEHTKAVTSQPIAPAYIALPADIRSAADIKLKRSSEFFASVVLTFVIRDLSLLLDKYAKKCEKWLAE